MPSVGEPFAFLRFRLFAFRFPFAPALLPFAFPLFPFGILLRSNLRKLIYFMRAKSLWPRDQDPAGYMKLFNKGVVRIWHFSSLLSFFFTVDLWLLSVWFPF